MNKKFSIQYEDLTLPEIIGATNDLGLGAGWVDRLTTNPLEKALGILGYVQPAARTGG